MRSQLCNCASCILFQSETLFWDKYIAVPKAVECKFISQLATSQMKFRQRHALRLSDNLASSSLNHAQNLSFCTSSMFVPHVSVRLAFRCQEWYRTQSSSGNNFSNGNTFQDAAASLEVCSAFLLPLLLDLPAFLSLQGTILIVSWILIPKVRAFAGSSSSSSNRKYLQMATIDLKTCYIIYGIWYKMKMWAP